MESIVEVIEEKEVVQVNNEDSKDKKEEVKAKVDEVEAQIEEGEKEELIIIKDIEQLQEDLPSPTSSSESKETKVKEEKDEVNKVEEVEVDADKQSSTESKTLNICKKKKLHIYYFLNFFFFIL